MLAQLCIEFQNLVLILERQALYALSTLRLSSILFTVQNPRLRKALLPRVLKALCGYFQNTGFFQLCQAAYTSGETISTGPFVTSS